MHTGPTSRQPAPGLLGAPPAAWHRPVAMRVDGAGARPAHACSRQKHPSGTAGSTAEQRAPRTAGGGGAAAAAIARHCAHHAQGLAARHVVGGGSAWRGTDCQKRGAALAAVPVVGLALAPRQRVPAGGALRGAEPHGGAVRQAGAAGHGGQLRRQRGGNGLWMRSGPVDWWTSRSIGTLLAAGVDMGQIRSLMMMGSGFRV
jgi:hypothetical protein